MLVSRMWKLFAFVLMTFRWLLVPALPVVGLFVGLMLTPRAKPRWEMYLPPESHCAGTVADGEMTYLLLYVGQIHELDMPAFHQLTGIDISTGAELFSRKIPCDRNEQMELLPGTTYALRWNRILHDAKVTLYDWKQDAELNQFVAPEIYYDAHRIDFKNGVLAVASNTSQDSSVIFWHLKGKGPPEAIKLKYSDDITSGLQLSANGCWAIHHHQSFARGRSKSSERRFDIIDTKLGEVVQSLPVESQTLRWQQDEDAFLALMYDEKTDELHWQRYLRINGSFIPSGPAMAEKKLTRVLSSCLSPYVVLVTTNLRDSIRRKVMGGSGRAQQEIFNRLWPVTTALHFMQHSTGEMVRRLTLPGNELFDSNPYIHPYPNGQGFVVQQGDHHLSFWEFSPASSWSPWIGLGVGTLLALFVARWNLRRAGTTNKALGSQHETMVA